MKLVGFTLGTDRMIGSCDGDLVTPLCSIEAFYADTEKWLHAAGDSDGAHQPLAYADLDRIPFVPETAKVLCVGLNYRSHAEESNMDVPQYPTVFGRWASTLVVDGEAIPVPDHEDGLDWEVELAVVVGKTLTDASEAEARGAILGYSGFNDVSARRRQFETVQWTLGKNPDRSAPLGPVLVTADAWSDSVDIALRTAVNGEEVQSSRTSQMIFTPAAILSYISKTATLVPGDVVATGTPEGVGFVRKPPRLLVPGDVLETELVGIGTMRNPIVESAYRRQPRRIQR
jgi:2-keto-4-pentenoate hydratase/2-oxohepta-3-ene-1,7-dioic acid hydratase in catechol pathway